MQSQQIEKSISFKANAPWFALLPTATGTVAESDTFLAVSLEKFTLRANRDYKLPVRILRYKIGLALSRPDGQWEVARWSEGVDVNETIYPGQTKLIENFLV